MERMLMESIYFPPKTWPGLLIIDVDDGMYTLDIVIKHWRVESDDHLSVWSLEAECKHNERNMSILWEILPGAPATVTINENGSTGKCFVTWLARMTKGEPPMVSLGITGNGEPPVLPR